MVSCSTGGCRLARGAVSLFRGRRVPLRLRRLKANSYPSLRLRRLKANSYPLSLSLAPLSAPESKFLSLEGNLLGRYELDVIDLYQHPQPALGAQIIAVPTLIRQLPSPLRRFIGDLSDTERELAGLDINEKT